MLKFKVETLAKYCTNPFASSPSRLTNFAHATQPCSQLGNPGALARRFGNTIAKATRSTHGSFEPCVRAMRKRDRLLACLSHNQPALFAHPVHAVLTCKKPIPRLGSPRTARRLRVSIRTTQHTEWIQPLRAATDWHWKVLSFRKPLARSSEALHWGPRPDNTLRGHRPA